MTCLRSHPDDSPSWQQQVHVMVTVLPKLGAGVNRRFDGAVTERQKQKNLVPTILNATIISSFMMMMMMMNITQSYSIRDLSLIFTYRQNTHMQITRLYKVSP